MAHAPTIMVEDECQGHFLQGYNMADPWVHSRGREWLPRGLTLRYWIDMHLERQGLIQDSQCGFVCGKMFLRNVIVFWRSDHGDGWGRWMRAVWSMLSTWMLERSLMRYHLGGWSERLDDMGYKIGLHTADWRLVTSDIQQVSVLGSSLFVI